jgi:hypothetical protein
MWTDWLFDLCCDALQLLAIAQSHLKLSPSPGGAQNDPFRINFESNCSFELRFRKSAGQKKEMKNLHYPALARFHMCVGA